MLIQIRELLNERKRMSLRELSIHFDTDPGALEPMLDRLVQKGQIRVINGKGCTGSCVGCFCAERDLMLVYEPC